MRRQSIGDQLEVDPQLGQGQANPAREPSNFLSTCTAAAADSPVFKRMAYDPGQFF